MRHLFTAVTACLALGACATPNTTATTPMAFDGTYQGTVTATHAAHNAPCSVTGTQNSSLTVQNGKVGWVSGGTNIYAPVMSDGAFYVQNGPVYFSGKISNRSMVARVNTGACHQIYDLTRPA